jgi:arginine exporter protein ArgO
MQTPLILKGVALEDRTEVTPVICGCLACEIVDEALVCAGIAGSGAAAGSGT